MYSLVYLKTAQKQLAQLDRFVAIRIKRKLDWLIENISDIEPERLHGDLFGLAKLREGDYRVIYEIQEDAGRVVVHQLGHRSDIYKK